MVIDPRSSGSGLDVDGLPDPCNATSCPATRTRSPQTSTGFASSVRDLLLGCRSTTAQAMGQDRPDPKASLVIEINPFGRPQLWGLARDAQAQCAETRRPSTGIDTERETGRQTLVFGPACVGSVQPMSMQEQMAQGVSAWVAHQSAAMSWVETDTLPKAGSSCRQSQGRLPL